MDGGVGTRGVPGIPGGDGASGGGRLDAGRAVFMDGGVGTRGVPGIPGGDGTTGGGRLDAGRVAGALEGSAFGFAFGRGISPCPAPPITPKSACAVGTEEYFDALKHADKTHALQHQPFGFPPFEVPQFRSASRTDPLILGNRALHRLALLSGWLSGTILSCLPLGILPVKLLEHLQKFRPSLLLRFGVLDVLSIAGGFGVPGIAGILGGSLSRRFCLGLQFLGLLLQGFNLAGEALQGLTA